MLRPPVFTSPSARANGVTLTAAKVFDVATLRSNVAFRFTDQEFESSFWSRAGGWPPETLEGYKTTSVRRSFASFIGDLESLREILVVGAEGFEPPTLCSQSRCATR